MSQKRQGPSLLTQLLLYSLSGSFGQLLLELGDRLGDQLGLLRIVAGEETVPHDGLRELLNQREDVVAFEGVETDGDVRRGRFRLGDDEGGGQIVEEVLEGVGLR